jgi:hypothetical protein
MCAFLGISARRGDVACAVVGRAIVRASMATSLCIGPINDRSSSRHEKQLRLPTELESKTRARKKVWRYWACVRNNADARPA